MAQQKDVLIKAPPMTPDGSVLLTEKEVRAFERDYELVKDVAGQFAKLLLAVILMKEGSVAEMTIPKDFIDKAEGGQIQVSEDADGNVKLKILSRAPNLIVLEGR